MKKEPLYNISIRCYYGINYTQHRQIMKLSEIPKWIKAYTYTHPGVLTFSVQIHIKEEVENEDKPPDNTGV